MDNKIVRIIISCILFILLFICFEWIYGFVIIGMALFAELHDYNFPFGILYFLGIPIALICSCAATPKLMKNRRIQAFINSGRK